MANRYSFHGMVQVNNKLFFRILTLVLMVAAAFSSTQTSSSLLDAPEIVTRDAYGNAIPYNDMKLDAQVVTSLSGLSRGRCIAQCLHEEKCQALNYRTVDSTCDLLGDYLCSGNSFLVYASGYRYFDVEKNGQITSMDTATSSALCLSDAICSPKCTCGRGFTQNTFSMLALPDSQVVQADTREKCMALCLAKPLDQCRGVNFRSKTTTCEHLQRILHESVRFYHSDNEWDHYERVCKA